MQVAHDDQVVKYENKNQQFSFYFGQFEKSLFMQKGSENTSKFRFLAGWLLGERKKSKIAREKHEKVSFSENSKK